MPADIRIIHAHEFIRANEHGQLDLEESKKLLMAIASAEAPSKDYDVLVDTREAHSEMSVTDLWELAAEAIRFREAFSRKTAILVPPERLDYAGFLTLCAQERDFNARAFTSLGDAVEWLART